LGEYSVEPPVLSVSEPKVLVVEDEVDSREFLGLAFKCEGYDVELVEDGEEAVEILADRHHEFVAVWLDLILPRRDGLSALREIRLISRDLPVFVTSGAGTTANIVEAMKAGATDFVPKPITHEILRNYMAHVAIAPRPDAEGKLRQPSGGAPQFLARSRQMRAIQATVQRISSSEAPVLIQGETGSGKEVLAREIHANSPRGNRPFLKLNCAALPAELVESELFGYERGAFTGAFQRKAGMFEMADRGTILLDEIGDMDFRLQAKLLQVLQDHEFHRLGGRETVHVDVRVMAATHRDLEEAIHENAFRQDLYYRLNVITITLPPLRERKCDIIPLAQMLLKKHIAFGELPVLTLALQQALLQHDWPGNIRELENVMRRFIILQDASELVDELSTRANRQRRVPMVISAAAGQTRRVMMPGEDRPPSVLMEVARIKDEAEADAIRKALESAHWNRKRAARMLNIDYKALLYKMKKLNIGEDSSAAATQG
jgi:two-component system, NtrC family, response regulator AtoC